MTFDSFQPPARILMGPGPSDVPQRVLDAMGRPTVGHLDPAFIGMMDELKTMLQRAFLTGNELTLAVSAPGSAGMEACFANLVSPGDNVLVCINGLFGERMVENVTRCGGEVLKLREDWGQPVDPEKLEKTLASNPGVQYVAFVHAETSTGALSDAETLSRIAHEHDCLVIMDAVTSLGGVPVRVDEWNIDAVYSGSQKCLSCTPGLSPVSFSKQAVKRISAREHPVRSWFLDMNLIMDYWGGATRAYHHTAPINALYGLHEALLILLEEGLEPAWQRHRDMHLQLRAGLNELGIEFLVDETHRLPQLNSILIPKGTDDAQTRRRLLEDYSLEIGAGLGPLAGKIWRVGLMGYSARQENVDLCCSALGAVIKR